MAEVEEVARGLAAREFDQRRGAFLQLGIDVGLRLGFEQMAPVSNSQKCSGVGRAASLPSSTGVRSMPSSGRRGSGWPVMRAEGGQQVAGGRAKAGGARLAECARATRSGRGQACRLHRPRPFTPRCGNPSARRARCRCRRSRTAACCRAGRLRPDACATCRWRGPWR